MNGVNRQPENAGDPNGIPWSYVPLADFRIPIFYGRRQSPNDLSFQEWKVEVETAFKAWRTPENDQAEFILRYLGGEAKREVLVMKKREKLEDILKLLKAIYGDNLPVSSILSKFYARNQAATESVRHYALSLQELSLKIPGETPESISDHALRDKFVDGLRSLFLKSEVRRAIRIKPESTFAEVKEETLTVAKEQRGLEIIDREVETLAQLQHANDGTRSIAKDELDGLKSSIKELQQQIRDLQSQVEGVKNQPRQLSDVEMKGRYMDSPQTGPKPPLICWNCDEEGHFARQCQRRYRPFQHGGGYQREMQSVPPHASNMHHLN